MSSTSTSLTSTSTTATTGHPRRIQFSSFSSTSQGEVVEEEGVTGNSDRSNNIFIVSELNEHSVAPTDNDVIALQVSSSRLQQRDHTLPSIEALPLSHFKQWHEQQSQQNQRSILPLSSRFNAVINDLDEQLQVDSTTKFVIFSRYLSSLELLGKIFDMKRNFGSNRYVLVDAKHGGNQGRERALRRFHDDPECTVCMLCIGWASAGLTLTEANVCYILEPCTSAAEEAQALSRVHRIGQVKEVRSVVFYIADSWEERLLASRQRRRELTEVLSGDIFNNDSNSNDNVHEGHEQVQEGNHGVRGRSPGGQQAANAAVAGTVDVTISSSQMKVLFGVNGERAAARR
eukprot:gene6992-14217_t